MDIKKDQKTSKPVIGGLSIICLSLLSACSSETPNNPVITDAESSLPYSQVSENSEGVSNRIVGATESVAVNQIFGGGYIATTAVESAVAEQTPDVAVEVNSNLSNDTADAITNLPVDSSNVAVVDPISNTNTNTNTNINENINSNNNVNINNNFTGAIGNAGGFGFNGSIASIIGNLGGFGFGGFGTFASFFAGSLPSAPPSGILIPPGVGAFPGTGNGFGPPPGSFAPPPGGFVPPITGVPPVSGIPPGGGGVPPGLGAGNGAGIPPGTGTVPVPVVATQSTTDSLANGAANTISISNQNLSELNTPLVNIDMDILLVSPSTQNSLGARSISALALTETSVLCAGGGTRTKIIDDVDPVGLSSGDTRTTVYTDCVRNASGGNVINGSRGFTTDEIIGSPFINTTWSTKSTMFRNNLVKTNAAAGTSRMTDGSTTTAISVTDNNFVNQSAFGTGSSSRTGPTNSDSSNFNFDMNFDWDVAAQAYTIAFNIDVEKTVTQSTGSSVETITPLSGILGQAPNVGEMSFKRLTDNVVTSIVTATAQADGTVLVEVDTNADGIPESSTIEADWSGVLFNIFNF